RVWMSIAVSPSLPLRIGSVTDLPSNSRVADVVGEGVVVEVGMEFPPRRNSVTGESVSPGCRSNAQPTLAPGAGLAVGGPGLRVLRAQGMTCGSVHATRGGPPERPPGSESDAGGS